MSDYVPLDRIPSWLEGKLRSLPVSEDGAVPFWAVVAAEVLVCFGSMLPEDFDEPRFWVDLAANDVAHHVVEAMARAGSPKVDILAFLIPTLYEE
jgi:hypothetical protein